MGVVTSLKNIDTSRFSVYFLKVDVIGIFWIPNPARVNENSTFVKVQKLVRFKGRLVAFHKN